VDFCRTVAEKLSKCRVAPDAQGDATSQLKWKLRALCTPFAEADGNARQGYQWPASRLTGDDMRRVYVLAKLSGLPCNEVLRVAVHVLFSQSQLLMEQAIALHEESQISLTELLDELNCHLR
jgi:hypothetical protein